MGPALPASLHVQLHAPCKLPPTALGSAFCNPVQMRPFPRVKDCLYVPSCSLRTSFLGACWGPVDCVALRDAPRCFCLFVDTSSLVARCTACLHQSSSQKKNVRDDRRARHERGDAVLLSLCFETHDGLREGLWRLLVAQSPFSRLALPHAILCYLSFSPR